MTVVICRLHFHLSTGNYTFRFSVSDGYDVASDNVAVRVIDISSASNALSNEKLTVYPNPSTGIVNIKKSGIIDMTYELYNTTGILVKSGNLDSPYDLDLRNMRKGLYFINITYDSGTETHKLILK